MKGQLAACLLLLSLAHGVWSKCPDICTLEYAPVCGSDGETYSNECFLEVASCHANGAITKVHNGECKDKRAKRQADDECPKYAHLNICTMEYAPVCASNGETYPNLCGMCAYMYQQQKEGNNVVLTVEYRGVCKEPRGKMADFCTERDTTGVCTREYSPICGSDGKTYGNRCTFCFSQYTKQQNGEALTMQYQGECRNKRNAFDSEIECLPRMKKGICTMEYFPVCGTDGKTYGNKCTFCYGKYQKEENGETLAVDHFGECQEKRILGGDCHDHIHSGICTDDYRPVCGSDGKTYANKCMFCFAKQQNGDDLTMQYQGECRNKRNAFDSDIECKPSMRRGICTLEYFPICGTDGMTYGNKCDFCFNKYQKEDNGESLSVDHIGECQEKRIVDDECPEHSHSGVCTDDYRPVCGSDGKTYANKCMFCFAKFQNGDDDLTLAYDGECAKVESMSADDIECKERYNTGVCTREYFPVCGTDGKTYANKCTFCYARHQKQQNGEALLVDHFGKCAVIKRRSVDEVTCLEHYKTGICTREYMPICGSDGKTHGNVCEFCFDKFQMAENGEELTIAHFDECEEDEKRSVPTDNCPESSKHGICTLEYAPVCANNGQTYGNECEMCADMYRKQQQGENVHFHVVHSGVC